MNIRHRILVCAIALFAPLAVGARDHSSFPVDIVAGPPPQPVKAGGRTWLVYELHLTNFAPVPIELTRIDVLGDGAVLATYSGQAIEKIVTPVEQLSGGGPPPGGSATLSIPEGHRVVAFFDVALEPGATIPRGLTHRFSFSLKLKTGKTIDGDVEGVHVPVVQDPVPVLRAPLAGPNWIAFNALGSADHRRSLNAVDGRERIPQRFAIDWMRLDSNGRLFRGDAQSNPSFAGYGTDVLAVADARVSDAKDGLAENAGGNDRSSRQVTLDNVVGNYVTLDLGHGRFALYAHLIPGSLKVKIGDTVKAGDILARLGNSGNSDAPHLHFQLMDANSPLASEGLPYELETFSQVGANADVEALFERGKPWQPKPGETAIARLREFPLDKSVVTLPGSRGSIGGAAPR